MKISSRRYLILLYLFPLTLFHLPLTLAYTPPVQTSIPLIFPLTKLSFLGVFVWDLSLTGYQINSIDFENNAAKWVYNGFASGPKLLLCDEAAWNPNFVGGPGVITSTSGSMERTYAGLASHDIIYYSLAVVLVGTWQPSDSFTIQIDNNPPKTYNPSIYSSLFKTMNCGNALIPSYVVFIVGKRFHTANMVTVKNKFQYFIRCIFWRKRTHDVLRHTHII